MTRFTKTAIQTADNDRPVVYTLKRGGGPIYVGIAKRGRVQERLLEHMGEIPATEFSTRSYDSIAEARKAEEAKIKRENPKYNDQHNG
jgi:predicted GIY-YIG superfamily endonuclease